MSLTVGSHIGPYEVVAPIGAGGMGEVFRGRDMSLNRDVAIKVLPAAVASDPDRLARFEREAQALAALNHPHIAQIYGLERSSHAPAIIMEFVTGEDLSVRIRRGPLPVAEALHVARQIAGALSAAHEAGIIHRDLKPANIKIADDGTVKVLDFGLAKALDPGTMSGASDAANSPTLTNRATHVGVILGTAAYMAPEQARGKAVGKQADIWAFGVVLFEMLTGRRPFDANDASDVLAYILTKEPDWTTLPTATPPLVRRLLQRCLTKDLKQRLHDIADARLELEETIASRDDGVSESSAATRAPARWSLWSALALAFVTLVLGALAGITFRPTAPAGGVTRALLDVFPAEELHSGTTAAGYVELIGGPRTALSFSPDGRTLGFIGRKDGVSDLERRRGQQVYLRDMATGVARALAGTDGARSFTFSADGLWIAFWAGTELRKVAVIGGPTAKVCDVGSEPVNGITWGTTRLIYAGNRRLFEVSQDGSSTCAPLTAPTGTIRHGLPHLLPDETALLFTEYNRSYSAGDERIMALPLSKRGSAQPLVSDGADARYAVIGSGYLLFLQRGTVFAARFDPVALQVQGEPTPVLDGVAQATKAANGLDLTLAAQLAVARDGTVAYLAAGAPLYPNAELISVDRRGRVAKLAAPERGYVSSRALSPDGRRVVVHAHLPRDEKAFLFDIRAGTLSPFAESFTEPFSPAWSSDDRVAITGTQNGTKRLGIFRPDASSAPEITEDAPGFVPSSWSPDGQHLMGTRDGDLWLFSLAARDDKWKAFLTRSESTEDNPSWSPDGKWIAYQSNSSTQFEVYVRPFPGPGAARAVSKDGGLYPVWNPKAGTHELFFVQPGRADRVAQMMAVTLDASTTSAVPRPLFDTTDRGMLLCSPICFSVTPDGEAFIAPRILPRPPQPPVTSIHVIFNWFEEVKAKVPAGR